jgi:hypothetical protein
MAPKKRCVKKKLQPKNQIFFAHVFAHVSVFTGMSWSKGGKWKTAATAENRK